MKKIAIILISIAMIVFAVPKGEDPTQEKKSISIAQECLVDVGDILIVEYYKNGAQKQGFKKVIDVNLQKQLVTLSEINNSEADQFLYDLKLKFAKMKNVSDGEWVMHVHELFYWEATLNLDDYYEEIDKKYFAKK